MPEILRAPQGRPHPPSPKDISTTRSPRAMNFRVFIIDKDLAMLSVSARLNVGSIDNGEPALEARGLPEDNVHFFERTVRRFRVEQVNDGEDEGVAGEGES